MLDLSLAHILVELKHLDFIIQVQVSYIRQTPRTDPDLRGLVISEQEEDGLLAETLGSIRKPSFSNKFIPKHKTTIEAIEKEIQTIRQEAVRKGITLRLEQLGQHFQLIMMVSHNNLFSPEIVSKNYE